IRDASHLWGRITGEVEDAILAELGDPRIRVAQIGPAGENLVRFASIANDLNEVAGRTGMGAVMGSKRLKAIAVRGRIPVKIADQPSPLGRYSVDPRYGGPEYESLASLGVNLGLDDLIAICKSNEMCNYLCMDTVSLGATLAWAMECFEKGILTLDDTDGVPLRFHDADGVVKLVEMIAYRRGIG